MPIPGSILGNMIPDQGALRTVLSDNHYPATCSFYSRSGSDENSGQVTYTYSVMDAAHQNIKCRLSPLIQIRPQLQEDNRQEFQRKDAKWQLNILNCFTDLEIDYQVVVGGITYRIVSIEPDGNGLTQRFELADVEPFGE